MSFPLPLNFLLLFCFYCPSSYLSTGKIFDMRIIRCKRRMVIISGVSCLILFASYDCMIVFFIQFIQHTDQSHFDLHHCCYHFQFPFLSCFHFDSKPSFCHNHQTSITSSPPRNSPPPRSVSPRVPYPLVASHHLHKLCTGDDGQVKSKLIRATI